MSTVLDQHASCINGSMLMASVSHVPVLENTIEQRLLHRQVTTAISLLVVIHVSNERSCSYSVISYSSKRSVLIYLILDLTTEVGLM